MRIIMGGAKESELDLENRFYVHKKWEQSLKKDVDSRWQFLDLIYCASLPFTCAFPQLKEQCLLGSALSTAILRFRMIRSSEI